MGRNPLFGAATLQAVAQLFNHVDRIRQTMNQIPVRIGLLSLQPFKDGNNSVFGIGAKTRGGHGKTRVGDPGAAGGPMVR